MKKKREKRKKEKDNVGKRQDTLNLANVYLEVRHMMRKSSPLILYVFNKETDARAALLELDCIYEAKDTGNLICTEPIIFGYYKQEATEAYEVILAGENLTYNLWLKAKESLEKYDGKLKKVQGP